MPVGSLSRYLAKFTSDHTYQSAIIEAETADHKLIKLYGMTWNLMNKGHSAAMVNGRSNNPFDLDETDAGYLSRKKMQLKSILGKIQHWGMDFVCLQEIDIFTVSQPPKVQEQRLAAEFFSDLKNMGWKLLHSHKHTENIQYPLITLYNTKTLELVSQRGLFKSQTGLNCALEAEFKYLKTGNTVCITNMHLDRNTDHNPEILQYQQQKVMEAKLAIIAGDTNPAKNVVYYELIGDENMATSIASDREVSKMRDVGFMVGPASSDTDVIIKEWYGAYFKLSEGNILSKISARLLGSKSYKVFERVKFSPNQSHSGHTLHQSHIGKPWFRKRIEQQQA